MSKYTTPYSAKPSIGPSRRKSAKKAASSSKPRYRKSNAGHLSGGRQRPARRHGQNYLRHSQGFSHRGSANESRVPYALIMVGCAALLFLASVIWFLNRDVEITLNGSTVDVRIHSTIAEIIEDQGLSLTPGDLLAVDDSVLEKKGGDSCAVTIDGEVIDPALIDEVEIEGGEVVTIEDGADVYEEHEVVATTIEPSITVNGSGAIQYVAVWGIPGRSEVWTGLISGITYDRGVVQEVQDCVIQCTSVYPDDESTKYVALTFDEGPSAYTEQILAILEEKGVKATFFLQGDNTETYSAAAAAIVAAGHEVGSNTYSDTVLSYLSGDDLRSQISSGFSAIEEATGSLVYMVRPPYAAWSTENWAEAMDLVSVIVTWNIDSGDWLLPGAESVVDTVVNYTSNGNIVLLTDNDVVGAQTVEALADVIDGLIENGFTLVTVSELIATDEDLAAAITVSAVTMPEDAVLPTVSTDEEETE